MIARRSLPLYIMLLTVILLAFMALVMVTRPTTPQIPRIVDEHGNNLVYQCPGDPRCNPTPVPIKH